MLTCGNNQKTLLSLWVLPIVIACGCATNTGGFIENDVLAPPALFGKNEDRNLTQTTALSFSDSKSAIASEVLLDKLNSALPIIRNCDYRKESKSELGITVFTPNDLDSFEPVETDRPYASLLYLTSAKVSQCTRKSPRNEPAKEIFRTSLTFGLLGTGIAEDTQRWLHITAGVSPRIPNGWGNQISDGGDLAVMYSVERQTLLMDSRIFPSLPLVPKVFRRAQLSYSLGARVGYYTDASIGVDLRVLLNNERFCSEFYDIGGSRLDAGVEVGASSGYCADPKVPPDRFGFVGVRARGILYNALMQGWLRESDHTFTADQTEDFVSTFSMGISDTLNSLCKIASFGQLFFRCHNRGVLKSRVTVAVHKRTAEYNTGVKGRSHAWGGIYVSRGVN